MDRADDRRRYFIVGSVILEIGLPMFRKRIKDHFTSRGFGSFQEFLSSQPVMHILFHLRHTNVWCCQDRMNCNNQSILPLNYHQWGLLFTKQKPQNHPRLCHCNYIVNTASLKDLDITLASLILLSCCKLGPGEYKAIEELRNCKNNYLSHNTDCYITEDEYDTLWTNLTTHVLQLDSNKQDDLVRLQNRPLDEALCQNYTGSLLDLHKKLEEVEANLNAKLEIILRNTHSILCLKVPSDLPDGTQSQHRKQYILGQDIFYLHQQIVLKSEPYNAAGITDGTMMDDGRIVLCDIRRERLVICNTDNSLVYHIPSQNQPMDVTAVNNSTVAVTFRVEWCIQLYDIDKKIQIKTIKVPGICNNITYLNNKFVVSSLGNILIIDYQTTNVVLTMKTRDSRFPLHATADRIYYQDDHNLKCVRYSDENVFTQVLPSHPIAITTLQDESVYAVCWNGQIQHISPDGQRCTTVTTGELVLPEGFHAIGYNPKQRKLFTCSVEGLLKVFCEI